MSDQNFENHRQRVTGFHKVLAPLILLTLIGSIYHLVTSWGSETQYAAALLTATNLALLMAAMFGRVFALKAQDRAIRAEEHIRRFARNGQMLDDRLTMRQIIGLRFASDEEWEALAQRAIDEGMEEDDIKKAVQNWKADTYRA